MLAGVFSKAISTVLSSVGWNMQEQDVSILFPLSKAYILEFFTSSCFFLGAGGGVAELLVLCVCVLFWWQPVTLSFSLLISKIWT